MLCLRTNEYYYGIETKNESVILFSVRNDSTLGGRALSRGSALLLITCEAAHCDFSTS